MVRVSQPYLGVARAVSGCPNCGSIDCIDGEEGLFCNDCGVTTPPRKHLDANEVYNRIAEYFALGLDIDKIEEQRAKLKAEVEQALKDWGADKFETAEGFKAGGKPGRKSVNHKQMAIDMSTPERVKELEPQYTKTGQPYFQIEGPRKI